jgi:hypothetical protein
MGTRHKELQPENRRDFGDGMKLHLRTLTLAGRTYRLITLRPGTDARFSTNYFHDTWHILSDGDGARLLARLLWGLAYQRQEGTLIALYGEHLWPTPFDADPSQPILLMPVPLTVPDAHAFRALKDRLPRLGPPDGTVRWQTFGLDQEVAARNAREGHFLIPSRNQDARRLWNQERMTLCGGWICYAAPLPILRDQAASVAQISSWMPRFNMGYDAYHYLADQGGHRHPGDGEVQIFPDYRRQVSEARVARREVRAESAYADPERLRQAVWDQRDAVAKRRPQRKYFKG